MKVKRRQPDEVTTRMAALTTEEEEGTEVPIIRILARPADQSASLYDADTCDSIDREG